MPYIVPEDRVVLDEFINNLQFVLKAINVKDIEIKPGHLNYIISRLIGDVFKQDPRYATIAMITGVLENVKEEFYRRTVVYYEDEAIKRNGDIKEYRK